MQHLSKIMWSTNIKTMRPMNIYAMMPMMIQNAPQKGEKCTDLETKGSEFDE